MNTALRVQTSAACPVCQDSLTIKYQDLRDYSLKILPNERYELVECSKCEVALTLPIETDHALGRYYPESYIPFRQESGLKRLALLFQFRRDLARIRKAAKSRTKGELFEIGAGNGAFLASAARAGYAISGIEPSNTGRNTALELFGLDLIPGLASDHRFTQRYQVIVLRHVIEHVADPGELLRNIFEKGLEADGVLYLKLPRYDSWERKWFGRYWFGYDFPRHRSHFSASGLNALLQSIGYTDVEIRSEALYLDLVRGMHLYAEASQSRVLRLLVKVTAPIQSLLGQLVAIALLPLRAGRMTVTACKPQ